MSKSARIASCRNIADLRLLARRKLPNPVFDYLDGAAEDEKTAARNAAGFDDHPVIPRVLVDVGDVSTQRIVMGRQVAWPFMCSPTGASRFFHPSGEPAAARAAAKAGVYYGLSTVATTDLETVALASDGPKMFQLYVFKDRGMTRELIARCKASGYDALCLTVDTPVTGKRERDMRSGWGVPIRMTPAGLLSFALHPTWVAGLLTHGALSIPNIAERSPERGIAAHTRFIGSQLDPSVSWDDLGEFITQWGGPFAIKGVMAAHDARRAVEVGASAVILSNHGGRQLDGAAAPIDVLPAVVDAVGTQLEIILEGGVRRGVHILKALALGATACAAGRPYLYGLAARGEAGASHALEILRTEFVRAMQLSGCRTIEEIGPHLFSQLPASSLASGGS